MASGEDLNPKGAAGRAKPQMHLIPIAAQEPIAKVMMLGAAKYGPHNWRDAPVNYTTYISAAQRHVLAFLDGQDQDPESGQSHLAHAAAGLMILLDAIVTGNARDDRPKKNPAYVEPAPIFPASGPIAAKAKGLEEPLWGFVGEGGPPWKLCSCEQCQTARRLKPRLLAEQPADSGSQDSAGTSRPTAPKL